MHWGRRRVRILEFTRCNDYRPDWREETEAHKTGNYETLGDRMLGIACGSSARMVSRDRQLDSRDPGLVCRDAVDGGTDHQ